MNQEVSEIDVLELIPQRPPFVMIDRMTRFDWTSNVTELTVREDNLFYEDGRLTSSGLIENIAQTCAARIGYINKLRNKAVQLGYIGGIRGLNILKTPLKGETIVTSIRVKEEVFKMTLVDAEVKVNGETIVTAEMKIALSDIEASQA